MANRKYNNQQILELHSKGLTDAEMAEIIGVTNNQMAKKRARLGLSPNKNIRDTYELNEEELSLIVGTLLGDSTIRYVHSQCKYPNLTFCHTLPQEEYFNWKAQKLKNLMSSTGIYTSDGCRKIDGSIISKCVYTGKNMACMTELRNVFYPNGVKIIPIEYIKQHFNELSLYCLYMDDGSYDKSGNSFILNTQGFTKENLEEFVQFLQEKFDLYFTIKKDNSLYLKHVSNNTFLNILNNIHVCPTLDYKLGKLSLNSVKQGNSSNEDNPVLNLEEIQENAERLEVMPNK